ncbi:hypothetical protein AC1031_010636 [Aphanomyces cochlioides]|nr:hypothetical protein AC1031_010636 [Aphanomyces cochlioides]
MGRSQVGVNTSLLNLPSPTERDHNGTLPARPVFPGSPIWNSTDSSSTFRASSRRRHANREKQRQPTDLTDGHNDWEYIVLIIVVASVWIAGVWFALGMLRFPFQIYYVEATLIVFGPLVPLYWLVRQLFPCAFRDASIEFK